LLSLGEALQIQWSPAKTEVAGDDAPVRSEKMGRVDGRLVPAPMGVAVARRGAPDPVVAGEN